MLSATCAFLLLALVSVIALLCIPPKKPDNAIVAIPKRPEWDTKATWHEIKTAWVEHCAKCEKIETVSRTAIRSWSRTFALCAALCLIGAFLEAKYDHCISIRQIVVGLTHERTLPASVFSPYSHPHSR